MEDVTRQQTPPSSQPSLSSSAKSVNSRCIGLAEGFAPPVSNTSYTPNQFFDVCLPYYSRGTVRIVAYLIRQTLGWCDEEGNPQNEQIETTYQELIHQAGVSRAALNKALSEAIDGGFIEKVREGQPAKAGHPSVSATYQLRWDDGEEYVKDPKSFRGFAEHGCRTDIPNQFFDHIVRYEPLSVTKVVGAIVRFSIGFQARRGARRQVARLSYQEIQRYAHIQSRADLSKALHQALDRNYIQRADEGCFCQDKSRQKKATYKLKWADQSASQSGSKSVPENTPPDFEYGFRTGSKNEPENRFKIRTRSGSKSVPEKRFKIRTSIQTKQGNEIYKQQQGESQARERATTSLSVPIAAAVDSKILNRLIAEGFDEQAAKQIAPKTTVSQIDQQVFWLNSRNPSRNRLGMLRRAIEEDWPQPQAAPEEVGRGHLFAQNFYAGYGGNEDTPTAEPSANDMTQAESYVARLLEIWPDEAQVPNWGRSFGYYVCKKQQGLSRTLVSLVVALRSHGDAYLKQHRQQHKQHQREQQRAADQAQEAAFKEQWLDYLREQESRLQQDDPDGYRRFDKRRASQRERIAQGHWQVATEHRLAQFDSEEERLGALREHFDREVLDFWAWMRQTNRIEQYADDHSHQR